MNTYYSYHSYHLAGKLYGTLGCALAWGIFEAGWWIFPLAAVLICLWLPVILGRPYFLAVTSASIAWGNGITRRDIPWEAIESIGYTPDQENKPGLKIELKDGNILDVDSSCFSSLAAVRKAILQASGKYPLHLAPDLFAAPGMLSE